MQIHKPWKLSTGSLWSSTKFGPKLPGNQAKRFYNEGSVPSLWERKPRADNSFLGNTLEMKCLTAAEQRQSWVGVGGLSSSSCPVLPRSFSLAGLPGSFLLQRCSVPCSASSQPQRANKATQSGPVSLGMFSLSEKPANVHVTKQTLLFFSC